MTASEHKTIMGVIKFCIQRIRSEAKTEHYEDAADDVATKLCFLADWLHAAKPTEKEVPSGARRKLSLDDQLKGVRRAILSEKTPAQLREGLVNRAIDLQRLIHRRDRASLRPSLE